MIKSLKHPDPEELDPKPDVFPVYCQKFEIALLTFDFEDQYDLNVMVRIPENQTVFEAEKFLQESFPGCIVTKIQYLHFYQPKEEQIHDTDY